VEELITPVFTRIGDQASLLGEQELCSKLCEDRVLIAEAGPKRRPARRDSVGRERTSAWTSQCHGMNKEYVLLPSAGEAMAFPIGARLLLVA
jgi:hypothetical protein